MYVYIYIYIYVSLFIIWLWIVCRLGRSTSVGGPDGQHGLDSAPSGIYVVVLVLV